MLEHILSDETLRAWSDTRSEHGRICATRTSSGSATVYEFLLAYHRGVMRREHVLQALASLYLGRTGSFLRQYAAAR